jgi:chromosome segregation ATPase
MQRIRAHAAAGKDIRSTLAAVSKSERQGEASRLLRQLGAKTHSYQLLQLGEGLRSTTSTKGFGNVISSLESIVRNLQAEIAQMTSHADTCNTKKTDLEEHKDTLTVSLTKITSRHDADNANRVEIKVSQDETKTYVANLETALAKLAETQAELAKQKRALKTSFGTAVGNFNRLIEVMKEKNNFSEDDLAAAEAAETAIASGNADAACSAAGSTSNILTLLETVKAQRVAEYTSAAANLEAIGQDLESNRNTLTLTLAAKNDAIAAGVTTMSSLDAKIQEEAATIDSLNANLKIHSDKWSAYEEECLFRSTDKRAEMVAQVSQITKAIDILAEE